MHSVPDRNFFKRAHLPMGFRTMLDKKAMFGPTPDVPTDRLACAEMMVDVLSPATRWAIAKLCERDEIPSPATMRRVCHRTPATLNRVAAAFGWVKQKDRWCHAADQPIHLPSGDNEWLACFVLYRACGGPTHDVAVG